MIYCLKSRRWNTQILHLNNSWKAMFRGGQLRKAIRQQVRHHAMQSMIQRNFLESCHLQKEEHAQKVFYFSCMQVTDITFLHQKTNYCHYFFVNNFGKSDFGAYFACHLVVN